MHAKNEQIDHKSRNLDTKAITNEATRTTAVTSQGTLTNLSKTFKLYDVSKI